MGRAGSKVNLKERGCMPSWEKFPRPMCNYWICPQMLVNATCGEVYWQPIFLFFLFLRISKFVKKKIGWCFCDTLSPIPLIPPCIYLPVLKDCMSIRLSTVLYSVWTKNAQLSNKKWCAFIALGSSFLTIDNDDVTSSWTMIVLQLSCSFYIRVATKLHSVLKPCTVRCLTS